MRAGKDEPAEDREMSHDVRPKPKVTDVMIDVMIDKTSHDEPR
jgi:hypothetical protein